MKRLFALILIAATFLMILPISGGAAETANPCVSVSAAEGYPGNDVTLEVSISNNPGITAFRFKLDYDSSALEIKNVEFPQLFSSPADGGPSSSDPYSLNWYSKSSSNEQANGVIAKLTFHIKEDAKPGVAYSVKIDYNPLDVCDQQWHEVKLEKKNGGVKVLCDGHTYDIFGVGCTKCGAHGLICNLQTRVSQEADNAYDLRALVEARKESFAACDYIVISLTFMDGDGNDLIGYPLEVKVSAVYTSVIAGEDVYSASEGNYIGGCYVYAIPNDFGVKQIHGTVTFVKGSGADEQRITYEMGTAHLNG